MAWHVVSQVDVFELFLRIHVMICKSSISLTPDKELNSLTHETSFYHVYIVTNY